MRGGWQARGVAGAVCFAAYLATTAAVLPAVEPWADRQLPVTEELDYWFDAARALGEQTVPATGQLAEWRDASGQKHDLQQPHVAAQPVRLTVGKVAVVRFDGTDDVLRWTQPPAERERVTIFVVAAPRRNPGGFRAVLAFNAAQQRDFESGLTLDLGPGPSSRFVSLNVEGRGFGTWKNLLSAEYPFGELRQLETTMTAEQVQLYVDGMAGGMRPRDGKPLSVSEMTVGARYYQLAGPQQVQGFGAWDVAEILVYGRGLRAEETAQVRQYLSQKYDGVRDQLPPDADGGASPLVPVKNPPAIQTLVPGFAVQELPVDLTNINNLLFRPDGTLVALAYNGTIWTLRDSDGDGLEDRAELFWDSRGALRSPIGMDLTPPGYARGDGVFVVAKTRCVLIVDTDKDGRADQEIVVAAGWPESIHQVDGLGVAFDKRDGSVYFGRGTYNFADPLLKDAQGRPQYRVTDEAGTILRVAADFRSREIVATGIRFPVGLRFDRHGELFATDQEGATWVPNGNPFDELLHIERGRHYGFPPRHPEHLPQVIDEPSVYDYGPQHQSTCGFAFNDPVSEAGAIFGPASWDGDAFVTGESRGKLYRTRLQRTSAGYVAQNQLFACLSMLTVDCCVAPDGSLRVACHSGGPDWGSGPTGRGKLFRIRYADSNHPQPVVVWPSGPREVRVEFDRPVNPQLLRDAVRDIRLTAGRYVRAGDRFESLWPGYASVQLQKQSPRYDIPVRALQLTPDRRTLVLATDPYATNLHYALTLPGMGRPALEEPGTTAAGRDLPQHPQIDLDFTLHGCLAHWEPRGGDDGWSGWLPHPDLSVSRTFTRGSAVHASLWESLREPGELRLRMRLDLAHMLQPAVQPGSQLDHAYPPESVEVTFGSTEALELWSAGKQRGAGKSVSVRVDSREESAVEVELRVVSAGGEFPLTVHFTTRDDQRHRALPTRRILLPWATSATGSLGKEPTPAPPPELAGGSWARGRSVFFGNEANCAKCHTIHGRGGKLGPDLSNLIHRDYASVLRDITQPSFAIHPDHLSYVIELQDGRVFNGVLRTVGDRLIIGDSQGQETTLARADVEQLAPSSISTMPEGLAKVLGPERLRDLLTFLLTRTPAMPDYGPGEPPPPRARREVEAVLADATPAPATRRLTLVLVSGRKDHGPGEHDYPAWQRSWAELLGIAENVVVETADAWPNAEQLRRADVLIFYQQGTWTAERARDMDAFLARGGGAVYIHYAVDGGPDAPGFAQRIGLAWQGGRSRFRHGPLELGFETGAQHPIGRHLQRLKLYDESYWQLIGDPRRIQLLAGGSEDGATQPLFWTLEPSRGRVVVSIPGHFAWTFDDPLFRVVLLRGIAWSARESVDRFNELVWPGARVRD